MINVIAAFSKNRVIGFKGKIPWDIPEDKKNFKRLTLGHVVIMGRKTYEEIGQPLPGRFNIVISSTVNFKGEMLYTARSLEHSLEKAKSIIKKSDKSTEIFLCGGERIYKEGIAFADTLYLTEIDEYFEGDAFFPELNNDFELTHTEQVSGKYTYRNCIYKRISSLD